MITITRAIAKKIHKTHPINYNTEIQPSHNQHLHEMVFILFQWINGI